MDLSNLDRIPSILDRLAAGQAQTASEPPSEDDEEEDE